MATAIAVLYRPDEKLVDVAARLAKMGLKISTKWTGRIEAVPINTGAKK